MQTILAAVLALTISSDKIDTFMHLPDWFPTSVDAEHTFGSDEHTNCTHRTTLDTLAAVESVFDAYHERVFYASEGRSSDWDVSVYGPRPTDLQRIWFTNTAGSASCFVYQTWTNSWPRATPDSRRLLEFDNVFGLASWIPSLFPRRTGVPWLDRGETWGRGRDIMFGSSWGPAAADLPEIDWTENRSFRPDLAASCVPLCYCMTDTVFKTSAPPSADGFLFDVLRGLDTDFNALYRIEGGPYPQYAVRTNGYLAEWHNSGSWTNSTAAKTSVPGIITNNFPLAGPEYGLTNLTRRLVPDDDHQSGVVTSYWKVVDSYHMSIDFGFDRPDGSMSRTAGTPVYVFDRASVSFVDGSEYIVHAKVANDEYGDSFELDAYNRLLRPPRDGEVVRFSYESFPSGQWVKYDYDSSYWQWGSSVLAITASYEKFVIEEDGAFNRSSVLATESRALAMLDRTYEIPVRAETPEIQMTESARDTERRFHSTLQADGSTSLQVQLNIPYTEFDSPVRLADLLGEDPEIVYTTTNVYSPISYPTVVKRRLTGGGGVAEGGMSASFPGFVPPSIGFTASEVMNLLVRSFEPLVEQGRWYDGFSASIYADNLGRVILSVSTEFGDASTVLCLESDLVPSSPVTIRVGGSVRLYRSASVFIGGVPPLWVFQRMYPQYGPGQYGYSSGTVGQSRVLFADEVMAFYAKIAPYGETGIEWDAGDPVVIPFSRTQAEVDADDRRFSWRAWHRIAARTSTGVNTGLPVLAYNESYETLGQKVSGEFHAAVGDYGSAEDVIPVSLNAVTIGDAVLKGLEVGVSVSESGVLDEIEAWQIYHGRAVLSKYNEHIVSPDEGIGSATLVVEPDGSGEVRFNDAYRRLPVAVDGRLSPVIVTDWDWKALKSERNNQ